MRYTFGGKDTDTVIQAPSGNSNVHKSLPNQFGGTAWSAKTAGSQYTDVIAIGTDPVPICTDTDGFYREFQGPDGIQSLWADFGGTRRLLIGREVGTSNDADLKARYASKGTAYVNAADYATLDLAAAALTPGCTFVIPQATYARGASSIVPPAGCDNVTVLARGATFTIGVPGSTAGWGVPIFDLLNINGWTLDIGLAQYVGVRGNHAGTLIRGQSPYALGSAVYTNGDRNHIRYLRSIGLPTPINLSSWDGTSATGRYGVGNRVGRLECEGYDFGILWIGQKNLVIDDIYAHDDIDDSSGASPTHAYYCTATTAWRSKGVTIRKARCENNLYGHAFQLKNCDQTQLGPHSADNSIGLVNVVDSDDLSWTDMKGTNIIAPIAGNAAAVTIQTVSQDSKRPILKNTSLVMAANQDTTAGLISIQAVDPQIGEMLLVANHSSGANTGTNDIVLRGTNGRIRGLTMKSVGAAHCRGILMSNAVTTTGWKIEKPITNGQRSMVDVQSGASGTGIEYDPAAQTLTGAGAAITGSTADYYVTGSAPTMGEADATSNLTLTSTATDIPGATVTIVPAVAGKLHVVATFDFSVAVSGEILGGYLNVDGTNQPQQVLMAGSLNRLTVTRHWTLPLTAASHTIKLQAARVSGSGTTHSTNATHTGFSYQFVPGAN